MPMSQPLVCLTLTASTLEENAALVRKYSRCIDVAELRVDFLAPDEQLSVRRFPAMVNVPCILTIRRTADGGRFASNEMSRTMLFGRALAFADQDPQKNFAYVDFEQDFRVPSLQDACLAFGVRIIRSCHDMEKPIKNLKAKCEAMRTTGYEIPKIAFMPKTLSDVADMFREASSMADHEHILCAMGPMGQVTRILAYKLHSYLTYVSPEETEGNIPAIGHIDPVTLNDVYRFRALSDRTALYAVTGWPLAKTSSPALHNEGYKINNIDALLFPLRSPSVSDVLDCAASLGVRGLAVTVPHKEAVIPELIKLDSEAQAIGACNTVVRTDEGWTGCNTDAYGFQTALLRFLGVKKLRHRRVAVIGAGGAAKAVAYVVQSLGAKACIFNRTLSHAKALAERYGFDYAPLGPEAAKKIEKYADIIVQTTSKGMNSDGQASKDGDPLYFYQFTGTETVFDLVYVPAVTPIMARAAEAGCKTCNGAEMLKYQGYRQFKIFTGIDYGAECERLC